MDAMALHRWTGSPPLELADISGRLPEVYLRWCKRREHCSRLRKQQRRAWRPSIACAAVAMPERKEMWFPTLLSPPPPVLTATSPMRTVTWIATLTVVRKCWQSPLHPLLDALEDALLNKRVLLELISEDLDPVTGRGKTSQASFLTNFEQNIFRGRTVQYSAELTVEHQFGSPAAITILNNHSTELYVETICLESALVSKPIFFSAESHVHTTRNSPEKRVFFKNLSYLPEDTPAGIREWRQKDLQSLRGDGTGERKYWERIYDYDVYNDVGHNDLLHCLRRPVLGGPERPYPRRLRTGRRKSKGDPSQESQAFAMMKNYVPRDEAFSSRKTWDFITAMKGALMIAIPFLETSLTDAPREFDSLGDICALYAKQHLGPRQRLLHKIGKKLSALMRHPVPRLLEGDTMRWNSDEEFGRQILAGMNPTVVERLKVFPPESGLDEATYGPKKSAITAQHLEKNLGGLTVEEALEQKRLYIVDYHDAILPLVTTFAAQGDKRKIYAPRVILFYTQERVFKPVAIELSLPPSQIRTKTTPRRVFTPGTDVTTSWLWRFAKIHFNLVDLGVHELYTHWLRAHVAAEPYIIATNRQLSSLHPVQKLLHPHFRYTLEINAIGRKTLVAPAGIIELCQFPGKHALFTSSRFYSLLWRFDRQSLPGDLIGRGMAEKDPTAPHGLKLALEDYPHAADGLLLWDSIETFVAEYLSIYYTDSQVKDDTELQAWWHEIRTVGHQDKKDEPWWPVLETTADLVQVVSTMIWTCSCHHAAANFGQYAYAGFMPNRPVHARRFIPEEGEAEWEEFLEHPDRFLLSMLPDRPNSTVQMLVTACLATHSRDEEYLGERRPNWTGDDAALKAFAKFSKAVDAVQEEMEKRNRNPNLKLRHGAGVIPYHLLYPKSGPGITGRGVPNSITI